MSNLKIKQEELENLGKGTLLLSPLAKAIRNYCQTEWGTIGLDEVLKELKAIYKKPVYQVATVEEFLNPKLLKALKQLENQKFVDDFCELVRIKAKGRFETGTRRRSFHSEYFGYHGITMVEMMRRFIRLHHYNYSMEEMLVKNEAYGFSDRVALELCRKNPYFVDTIREMIEGENNFLLTRSAIEGIIKSDHEELQELLLKLLVAAGAEEGLRQSILESADDGSLEMFKSIYQCCMEHDLFRFSSAARALYAWSGFYIEKLEIAETRRIANLGWNCLIDPDFREKCLESDHPYELYFAVWAMGCEEVQKADQMAKKLIEAKETYKKYVGWHFVSMVQNESYQHNLAVSHLDHLDEEEIGVVAVVTDCLHVQRGACYVSTYQRTDYSTRTFPDDIYPADVEERRELFWKLKKIAIRIGKNKWNIDGYLFPWSKLIINQERAEVMRCMVSLAAYDGDPVMIDELYELSDIMDPDLRRAFFVYLLDADHNATHRQYLWNGLKDRSIDNKITAVKKLQNCKVCEEDVRRVCEMLNTKSATVKKTAVSYLKELDTKYREVAIETLLAGKENLKQVALELMIADETLAEKYQSKAKELKGQSDGLKLTDETLLLLDQLVSSEVAVSENDGEELLYGIIDTKAVEATLERLRGLYPQRYLTEKQILALYPKKEEVEDLLEKIWGVFSLHADYEYEVEKWDGGKKKVLFGEPSSEYFANLQVPAEYGASNKLANQGKLRLYMVPFAEEFREAMADYLKNPLKLAMILYSLNIDRIDTSKGQSWIKAFRKKYCLTVRDAVYPTYKSMLNVMETVIELALKEIDSDETFRKLGTLFFSLCHELGEEHLNEEVIGPYTNYLPLNTGIFNSLLKIISFFEPGDEAFAEYFAKMYVMERGADYGPGDHLDPVWYLRAVDLGVISENELYDWSLHHKKNPYYGKQGIYMLSSTKNVKNKEFVERYPWLKDSSTKFLDAVVRYEAKRGQAETPITAKLRRIERIEGVDYFCLLLKALGKESFFRGYSWANDGNKAASLSSLLKKCWPAEGDTVESLKAQIKETRLTEKRLVEAAMYAPQWAAYVEEITGWKGLKKAIWLFHAHISEAFSSEKETEVAIYSPITPQEFNDGVFDIAWFRESYEEMGEKRFKQLYNFAKYITDGSNAHRRSQLYADATLGKLDPEELEKEIVEKRNQERLRAYALIPVKEEDLLHRYEFIQQYIKGSKQFGAQRRESEKRAATAAIRNLAITSGYMDVNRMLWKLENEKNEEIKPLLILQNMEGYDVALVIDEQGNASLRVQKGEKTLKSIPKAIAKKEMILDLKETVKELKDQKSRGKKTLEDAMIHRTQFGVEELKNVMSSLTIAPMAKSLIWKAGDFLGYPMMMEGRGTRAMSGNAKTPDTADTQFILVSCTGEEYALPADAKISIAHPHHLFLSGQWSDYMHDAFERQIVQPFKQIFREYYPVTEEEKQEKTISRRYAGYQVQPQRTVGLLKNCGWTVDYEEGLQKVCYEDNLIVRMYAMADWFSPADIEVPTLEIVQFYDRKTGAITHIEDVNPITFSEVMRDLDLVVSVAYVGGVEIETSHSTVQMRVDLAKELVSLMKLGNVTFTDHHARIEGKLASYSVHMGSGIVHAGTKGMIPILPVHSQHRGRIFLPFADEDPRTAEIMSKIILLSEDKKIKDPEILKMLK